MTLQKVLRPKQPLNLALAVLACAFALGLYWIATALGPFSPKRGVGLLFGILAALFFVFEMVYPFRRPRARPLGRAQVWLQLHIYVGLVAFLGVLIHTGFSLPHGPMGWGLFLLSTWTIATGLVGVWLQKWVPSALSDGLRIEALYDRIPALIEKLTAEADALMETATSDILLRVYEGEVRTRLATVTPSWSYLLNVRSGRDRALEPLRRVDQFLGKEDKEAAEDLEQIYDEKLQLDAQYSLQGILRRWLILHAPPAGLLMGLLVIHILSWVLY